MNRSALLPVEKVVLERIEEYFPDPQSVCFVVGVSGGMDSMCLLHIFKELEVEALACHINYQKRGAESDKDAKLVEQMADEWGFEFYKEEIEAGRENYSNFQQWARQVRYSEFRKLMDKKNADAMAVAHHQDDQLETILQKLFRGAGIESWSGMSFLENGIFRPLLDLSRDQIEKYADDRSIPYRHDITNMESEFARNFLRNEWLEELEKHYPGWRQNVLRLPEYAEIFTSSIKALEKLITDDRNRIDCTEFNHLNGGLRKALILHILKKADQDLTVSRSGLDRLDKIEELQTGQEIEITSEFSFMRDRNHYKIVSEREATRKITDLSKELLENTGFQLNDLRFHITEFQNPDYGKNLYLDAGRIDWPLRLRYWKDGDKFQPFGMSGHQNISDHLTNRKVESSERGKALVLESFEETIYAIIFPPIEKREPPGTISEKVRCDKDTSRCLKIYREEN